MRTDTPVQFKLAEYKPFPFAIDRVDLRFILHPDTTRVLARLEIRRTGPGDLRLDGVGLELKAIAIDAKPLPREAYILSEDSLRLTHVPDTFELTTEVEITPSQNTELSGLYMSGGRFCTQCEATGFRRITYWPDRPDVMSRFHVRIEAEADTYPILLSNGTPGASGRLDPARHFAEWDDPHPKPSYLFALCAGKYDVYRDTFLTVSGKHVDLAIHADTGDSERAAWAMESLKASMRWDEDVFGREYDLGVFNIVAVRDFNFGAMENKGLNIFNSAYVLADEATATDADFEAIESIVGHEYFHNWTGNRITCRDWFQLCLKEGLTVFRDQEFSADMRSRAVQRIKDVIRLRARQFAEDAGPLAHPVRPDTYASIDNLYTATVYEKGAELIRMLKTLIGDENFARGMQLYFDRHDGEATTIEHFYACFEQVSGQDLSGFRQWYSQPGTPQITLAQSWSEHSQTLSLTFTQDNPVTPQCQTPQPMTLPLKLAVFDTTGNKLVEETLIVSSKTTEWVFTDCPTRPLVSLNRGFSAPIKLTQKLSDADRLRLAEIDDDPFNQWQALQSLFTQEMLELAYSNKAVADPGLITACAQSVLRHKADPAYAALLLRLPDIAELMIVRRPADPEALFKARKHVQVALCEALYEDMQAYLATPTPQPFRPDAEQAGIRALRTAFIALLGAAPDKGAAHLPTRFEAADNMTESLASLRALCATDGPGKNLALSAFYARWSDNPLVIDKWFSAQAAHGDASTIRDLLAHPDFDYSNPNRVRAVMAVFGMQNLSAFHARDGSGYALLAETIETVDSQNGALAARLLTAFEQWRSLDPEQSATARNILEDLKALSLSQNSRDILSRMLGE